MSIETVRKIVGEMQGNCTTGGDGMKLARDLGLLDEELQRIASDDFHLDHRMAFLDVRRRVGHANSSIDKKFDRVCRLAGDVNNVLAHYIGIGSADTRDFSFVFDTDVRSLVERDFEELESYLKPNQAWKSMIVMCGSILEAVLYDQLTKDAATIELANASTKAPKRTSTPGAKCPTCNAKGHGVPSCATCNQATKSEVVKDISSSARRNSWSLSDLITVACDIGLLNLEDENAVHLALREFRNFVHPRVEIRKGIPIGEGPATTSYGMLITILDQLS